MTAVIEPARVRKWTRPAQANRKYTFDEMIQEIKEFTTVMSVNGGELVDHRIYIGTDSQRHGQAHSVVTAVGVLRRNIDGVGRGSIYFHTNDRIFYLDTLRKKLSTEAWRTLETFYDVKHALDAEGLATLPIELHFDVNPVGDSKIVLSEVKNIAASAHCDFKVKPEAFMASGVADRYSK